MRIDWDDILKSLTIIFGLAVLGAFIITTGWFIGSANAHSTRIQNEHIMSCLDRGGNMVYVAEVGKVCHVDD